MNPNKAPGIDRMNFFKHFGILYRKISANLFRAFSYLPFYWSYLTILQYILFQKFKIQQKSLRIDLLVYAMLYIK